MGLCMRTSAKVSHKGWPRSFYGRALIGQGSNNDSYYNDYETRGVTIGFDVLSCLLCARVTKKAVPYGWALKWRRYNYVLIIIY